MKSLYFKFHVIWLKTVGIIYKKLKAYIFKIGGCTVPAVRGCGGSCSHFWEVHGGQFFLNMYKDIKTDDIFQLSSKLVKKS